ncbi:ankyrin repeat-containing domain protein [Lactarius quietus]|nr:ankyrin repeat-containing domain protein [Lactarius quietus]
MTIQQTATGIDEIKWNQWKQLLRTWLSPADPSTNHNIARKAQHEGTAVWLFQGKIVIEWKSTGSLLWIYGKPGSGKSVICSSVIQDIMAVCETGSTIMAYFYFDFRDLNKQTCHDLLRSLVFQLSTHSSSCCDILHRIYETHKGGTQQPSDDTLQGCLIEMLRLLAHGPVFIVLDAIDECPDSSGFPPPRSEVLQLVKELVDLHLRGLYICATSRPEVDIRAVFEPLASRSVSLHDESGQKEDIADYVRNVVNSSPSTAMRRWRAEDKNLVIETLTERADGMFRWVYCQLERLQYCFPSTLRRFINELPETLDETYDRILKGINRAQKDDAHRLLQCLTVASRPLRVKELAELLAFEFEASSSGGIPQLREDWRWDDEEEAVLSTCSSLIAIVPGDDSPVVQFSHFSVKEYLTSPRLAQSPHRDVSQFHIDLESAHTIMAQACLATLLQLDEHSGKSDENGPPLAKYAAQHWVGHAQFAKVSSCIQGGMDGLFDSSKPHFAAWLRVHNIDEHWSNFSPPDHDSVASPLYYAAFCGFYDLAERLIMKHPEQVNVAGCRILAPLPAALSKEHFHVADLLYRHGAVVDVQDYFKETPLHAALATGQVDVMRWLLDHGTDPDACGYNLWAPLHYAARNMRLDAVQVLLTYNADVNPQTVDRRTPLHMVFLSNSSSEREVADMVRRLLEHGADPNIPDQDDSTPLHKASSLGWIETARLLLSYGAKVDDKDGNGMTPFQVSVSKDRMK